MLDLSTRLNQCVFESFYDLTALTAWISIDAKISSRWCTAVFLFLTHFHRIAVASTVSQLSIVWSPAKGGAWQEIIFIYNSEREKKFNIDHKPAHYIEHCLINGNYSMILILPTHSRSGDYTNMYMGVNDRISCHASKNIKRFLL